MKRLFRSIRWRLQIWYGLILVVVLSGFGITAYQLERGRQFRKIDGELQRRASVLAGLLRPPPRRGPDGPDRPRRTFPPEGGGEMPGRPRDPGNRPPLDDFHLPPQHRPLFENEGQRSFHYIVWARDGRQLGSSPELPLEFQAMAAPALPASARDVQPQPPSMRSTGNWREATLVTPPGERVWIGRSVAEEQLELRRIAWVLTGVGAGILLLGLAGGWWFVSRAIRPIASISSTAAQIATGDLSRRIATADTDSELGQLTEVLNSTFARLENAFAQQQRFTADAAHELRTPVSVMLTQTQTALARERPAADYRQALEACQRAGQRMRRLIESLLQLARIDAGQEPVGTLSFDLATTAADCADMVRPLTSERDITLSTNLRPVECRGNAEHLSQVIINLLTNAIQYNRDKGEVVLDVREDSGWAVITVSDTGPGIAPEVLPHIFDRFYRADPARTTAAGRTGLGLAITKSIVESHQGKIEVESKAGRGSRFTVRLPATGK